MSEQEFTPDEKRMINKGADEIQDTIIDIAIGVLNRALDADASAIHKLMEYRVFCNRALAEDPTIQVLGDEGEYKVGPLGLINGITGIRKNGWGYIAAVYDVICRQNHFRDEIDSKVGDPCPKCGEPLELGPLIKFIRLSEEEVR